MRKQNWNPGNKVNVGFRRGLLVVAALNAPRGYLLMDDKRRMYIHEPYQGCFGIDDMEAQRLYSHATARIDIPSEQVTA